MTGVWGDKVREEVAFPATVALVVVLITAIILFIIRYRGIRGLGLPKGTKYVVDTDGNQVVRRSTRSVRKPTRFEPVLHGQGGESTPSKEGSPGSPVAKLSPKIQKTPKAVADAVKSLAQDSPANRRGRPKKVLSSDSASPTTSPARTRRSVRSPS